MKPQRHEDTKIFVKGSDAHAPLPPETEGIVSAVIDAAFKVHAALGPGLLESIYEACICHELNRRGISFNRQVAVPMLYEGMRLDGGLRLDLVVAELVVVELKSVELMHPVYEAQLLSHLKLTGLRLGLLINFNVPLIKHGIKRVII